MSTLLVLVSRPGQTKITVPWELSQCQVQETVVTHSEGSIRDAVATGRAMKEFGPNTFDIMRSIIAQKNSGVSAVGGASGHSGPGAPKWILHEVLHGCLGQLPGNTFSFIIRRDMGHATAEKALPPGY